MDDSIFDVDSVKQEIAKEEVIEQAQSSGDLCLNFKKGKCLTMMV